MFVYIHKTTFIVKAKKEGTHTKLTLTLLVIEGRILREIFQPRELVAGGLQNAKVAVSHLVNGGGVTVHSQLV